MTLHTWNQIIDPEWIFAGCTPVPAKGVLAQACADQSAMQPQPSSKKTSYKDDLLQHLMQVSSQNFLSRMKADSSCHHNMKSIRHVFGCAAYFKPVVLPY